MNEEVYKSLILKSDMLDIDVSSRMAVLTIHAWTVARVLRMTQMEATDALVSDPTQVLDARWARNQVRSTSLAFKLFYK